MDRSLGIIGSLRKISNKEQLSQLKFLLFNMLVLNPKEEFYSVSVFNPLGSGIQIVNILLDLKLDCNLFVPTGMLTAVPKSDEKEWKKMNEAEKNDGQSVKIFVFEGDGFKEKYNDLKLKEWNSSIGNTLDVFKTKCTHFLLIDNGSKAYLNSIKSKLPTNRTVVVRPSR
jgi:hypothetical protein